MTLRATAAALAATAAALVAAPTAHATFGQSTWTLPDDPAAVVIGSGANGPSPLIMYATLPGISELSALGLGEFSLLPETLHPFEFAQHDLLAVDVTGDGKRELITVLGRELRLQSGMGPVTQVANLGIMVDRLAAGDFDGDGHVDVAGVRRGSNSVAIAYGAGDGTFGNVKLITSVASPTGIAAARLGGSADSIVVGSGTSLITFPGSPSRTYGGPDVRDTTAQKGDVLTGEVTGDGHVDVLVHRPAPQNDVLVLFNDGGGTVNPTTTFQVPADTRALRLADVDGDGRLDALYASGDDLVIRRGLGLGSFLPAVKVPLGFAATSLAVGEIDGAPGGAVDVAAVGAGVRTVKLLTGLPKASPDVTSLAFGSASVGAVASQTLTITNSGLRPLTITDLVLEGAGAADFETGSDTCRTAIDPGGTCTVAVRFAPSAAGARTAKLRVASADAWPSGAAYLPAVDLTGTGVALPVVPGAPGDDGDKGATGDQGAPGETGGPGGPGAGGRDGAPGAAGDTGAKGTSGARGAAGPAGAQGPAGADGTTPQIRLTTCTTRKTKGKARRRCTTKTLAASATFAPTASAKASLARGGRVYATGTASRARGVRLTAVRRVPAGRYTLTLRTAAGKRTTTTITIR